MPKNTFAITFEIEPIVNVRCVNTACVHNLVWAGFIACNLKHIGIGDGGKCEDFVAKSSKPPDKRKDETADANA